jgi:GAF domain-containing protein
MSLTEQLEALAKPDRLSEALRLIIEHFHADTGTIHLLESDGVLHLRAASAGIPPVVLERVQLVPIGKGMAGLAAERKEPVTVCNIQTDTSGNVKSGAKLTGMEGALVVPMLKGEAVAGTLGIANRQERTFTPEETALLLEAGRVLARASGN